MTNGLVLVGAARRSRSCCGPAWSWAWRVCSRAGQVARPAWLDLPAVPGCPLHAAARAADRRRPRARRGEARRARGTAAAARRCGGRGRRLPDDLTNWPPSSSRREKRAQLDRHLAAAGQREQEAAPSAAREAAADRPRKTSVASAARAARIAGCPSSSGWHSGRSRAHLSVGPAPLRVVNAM